VSGIVEPLKALKTRLTAASPGAAVPPASVAWPGINFTPTAGVRWYRATLIPGIPTTPEISTTARNRHVGIFQIDVFDPIGLGDGPAIEEGERIVSCFKRGTVLTESGVNVVVQKASVMTPIEEDSWYHVPVRIQFRADIAN